MMLGQGTYRKYSCIMFSTKDYTLDSRGDVGAGYVQSTHVSCSPPRITPWTAGVVLGQGTYKVLQCHQTLRNVYLVLMG